MSADLEFELERATRLRGFRYGVHDFVGHADGAEALKKWNDHMEDNYLKGSLIDRKTKELVIIAACIAQKDWESHMQLHMHAAHKAGATPEEIRAIIDLIGIWVGDIARLRGLEAWRATFRPDIPTINRIVELR